MVMMDKMYHAINLPKSFRKKGLKVKITTRGNRDVMGIPMFGTIIEIIDIKPQ